MEKLIHKPDGRLVSDIPFYCTEGARVRLIAQEDYTGSNFPKGTEGIVDKDDARTNNDRVIYEKRGKGDRHYVMAHWTGHFATWIPLEFIEEVV